MYKYYIFWTLIMLFLDVSVVFLKSHVCDIIDIATERMLHH